MFANSKAALKGLKVLSLSHVVAGPLAASMLADLGADVVHVEQPKVGDAARHIGFERDGVYVWWKVAGRNKRSVTIDLRKAEGAKLALELVSWADVVISSIRPMALKKWGLSWDEMRAANRRLIMLQITGFGMARGDDPGFGKVGEAMSGVVDITGHADEPLHTAFSHGDATTGLMGAFSLMAALYRRANDPDFAGELIDLALYETLFRLIEWQVISYDQLKMVAARNGNRLGFAPAAVANVYKSRDDVWVTVTSATIGSVLNIVKLLGLPIDQFKTVAAQREKADLIDGKLRDWIGRHTAIDALAQMATAGVVASKIYSIKDIMEDETYKARENIVTIDDRELGPIKMQNVVPKLTNHAGNVWRSGAQLGEDNEMVFREWLGLSAERLDHLRNAGVI